MSQTLSVLAASGGHGGGFGLHQMLIVGSTAIVVLVLIALAAAARGQIGVVPRGLGAALGAARDDGVLPFISVIAFNQMGCQPALA